MHIIIVGAGPAGLTLALLLAKQGIHVVVLEANDSLDDQPRATHYSPPALHELQRAGVLEDARKHPNAFIPNGLTWRRLDGSPLATLNMPSIPAEYQQVCLPLNQLTPIILQHLMKQPTAEVRWKHRVMGGRLGQDHNSAWVTVQSASGEEKIKADYVVGCDGGNSVIRKSLFEKRSDFAGHTWDAQIIASTVYYEDYYKHAPDWTDSNFLCDVENWAMVAKIQADGLLKITYGEVPGLTDDEYLERLSSKYQTILPGHPTREKFNLVQVSPYKVHQRCAPRLRIGRFLLAADAAHLCNPFGGLGLTGGLVDVGNLFDCLNGIHKGLADEAILDRYDEVRRQKWRDIINPVSSGNITTIWTDPAQLQDSSLIRNFKEAEGNSARLVELLKGGTAIMHDFTKEYHSAGSIGVEA
ncbi:hypothetical protein N8I77_010867 [Diaporthe amygdali]|uniref:FAD-binding domain-containing protein n=1 Tax=Phomopsis amygdali TaxID=1214568 RepID=A0AAD9S910_PHOAM|nr:hypothetical protein N8I77_010867 [Diaporthe amygdali]